MKPHKRPETFDIFKNVQYFLKDAIHRLVNRADPQRFLSFKENSLRGKQREPA